MDSQRDYWRECIKTYADECGASLTDEQIADIADGVQGAHENYGMAFYSPPSSDRIAVINSEWEAKYRKLEREFESYRGNAESAVRKALNQYPDAHVTIHDGGEVLRHDGRTDVIQS